MAMVTIRKSGGAPAEIPEAAVLTAIEYIAEETLRSWRTEAKLRQITTPVPAAVRWRWGGENVAPPPRDLMGAIETRRPRAIEGGRPIGRQAEDDVLTSGIVTRLRTDLYQADVAPNRIVVLGGAGAGKTTAMILLLIDILECRQQSTPTPVMLTLSNWNPEKVPLEDWMAEEIVDDYPELVAHGGRQTVKRLLRAGRLALFLDGLDELPPDIQGRALAEIDKAGTHLRIVLSSRNALPQDLLKRG